MIRRLQRAGETSDLHYDPERFSLLKQDSHVWQLHNFYQEYLRADKSEREQILNTFLAAWSTARFELLVDFFSKSF